jgi:hypothetical protein
VKSVKCTQCGHENDLTRAFCQNCGARLERPQGDDPKISGPTKVPAGTQPRGSRPARARFGDVVLWLIGRILTAGIVGAMLAALIQMGRQPDGVPAAEPANEAQAGQLLQALQTSAESTYARAIEVTQAQANNYLASSILPDPSATGKAWQADFSRAFVLIKSGQVDFFVEQRFHGWPIYMYLTTVPETSGGKSTLKVTGGGVGRMPLSMRLIPLLEGALRPVIASTSEAAAVLETADEVVLAPLVAKLSWHARKPGAP